jgi:hypothetical protein
MNEIEKLPWRDLKVHSKKVDTERDEYETIE